MDISSICSDCGLLMPDHVQKSFFILRAFNAELASVKEIHYARNQDSAMKSTSPSIGLQLRLKWWIDAIREIYGDDRDSDNNDPSLANLSISCWESPIVRALYLSNQEMNFTRRFLERLVESRELDLELDQFGTLDDAKRYAEHSVSSLLYLTLECFGVREDLSDAAASFAGTGIGLTTALRGTPIRLTKGELPIPANLFRPEFSRVNLINSLYGEGSMNKADSDNFREAVRTVATTAASYLAEARERQGQIPKAARTVLLPVVPALHYLSRLEKVDYDVLDKRLLEPERFALLLFLGRTWITGVF